MASITVTKEFKIRKSKFRRGKGKHAHINCPVCGKFMKKKK